MVRLKAIRPYPEKESWIVFQFLMVRLKANADPASVDFTMISIPYGSIKRAKTDIATQVEADFNSLWFD